MTWDVSMYVDNLQLLVIIYKIIKLGPEIEKLNLYLANPGFYQNKINIKNL